MGLLSAAWTLRERIRIFWFEASRIIWLLGFLISLAWQRRWLFATSGALLLTTVMADRWLWMTPDPLGPATIASLDVLFTTVAAISAAIQTVLVSASMVLLNSAATRFPAGAITYISGDRTRTALLGVLFINISFSFGNLALYRIGVVTPRIGAISCVIMLLISLAGLISFLPIVMHLFHPSGLATRLAQDIVDNASRVAVLPKRGPGISVETHIRNVSIGNVGHLRELVMLLLEKRQHREVAEVIQILVGTLSYYVKSKHQISNRSNWFPRRFFSEPDSNSRLRYMFENLALGTPQEERPDHEWLEQHLVAVLQEAGEQSLGADAFTVVRTVLGGLQALAKQCIEAQEFTILDRTLSVVDLLRSRINVQQFDELGPNLIHLYLALANDVQRVGLDVSRIESLAVRFRTLTSDEIWSARLPRVLAEELLGYRDCLDTEMALERRYVSPSGWLVADLKRSLANRQSMMVIKHSGWASSGLEAILTSGLSGRVPAVAGPAYANLVLAAQRGLVLGNRELAVQAGLPIRREAKEVIQLLRDTDDLRIQVFNQLRLLVLRVVSECDLELTEILVPPMCMAVAMEHAIRVVRHPSQPRSSEPFLPRDVETILVLGGLSLLASEFTREKRYLEFVIDQLVSEGIQLDRLASDALPLIAKRNAFVQMYNGRLIEEYHRFFNQFSSRIDALSKRPIGSGMLIVGSEPDHESEFVRRIGSVSFGIDPMDCIQEFLGRLIQPASRNDEDDGAIPTGP